MILFDLMEGTSACTGIGSSWSPCSCRECSSGAFAPPRHRSCFIASARTRNHRLLSLPASPASRFGVAFAGEGPGRSFRPCAGRCPLTFPVPIHRPPTSSLRSFQRNEVSLMCSWSWRGRAPGKSPGGIRRCDWSGGSMTAPSPRPAPGMAVLPWFMPVTRRNSWPGRRTTIPRRPVEPTSLPCRRRCPTNRRNGF